MLFQTLNFAVRLVYPIKAVIYAADGNLSGTMGPKRSLILG
ncbi:MAG: hypothetical protein AAGD25_05800 [Cyanobacteria bacterium P01_F01_bin.150]